MFLTEWLIFLLRQPNSGKMCVQIAGIIFQTHFRAYLKIQDAKGPALGRAFSLLTSNLKRSD